MYMSTAAALMSSNLFFKSNFEERPYLGRYYGFCFERFTVKEKKAVFKTNKYSAVFRNTHIASRCCKYVGFANYEI